VKPKRNISATAAPGKRWRGSHIAHPYADRGADLYETPAVAVQALLRVESPPHCIWEPAAGRGAIVRELRAAGPAVIASDLIDYGFPLHFVGDFMAQTKAPAGCECVLTNPHYQRRILNPFIEHALDLSPRVILLARLALLESDSRTEILEHRGLARVHVFRDRLPMMHRDGWTGPIAASDRLRVVRLGTRSPRASHHPSHFVQDRQGARRIRSCPISKEGASDGQEN
jgi:hypothetical protein